MFTADNLRRNLTLAGKMLWDHLRAHRCLGWKFRRQHQIGRTIVDFVCLKEKLVIELDGMIHETRREYDEKRDSWLRSKGYRVLRIKNEDVEQQPGKVLSKIKAVLTTASHHSGF